MNRLVHFWMVAGFFLGILCSPCLSSDDAVFRTWCSRDGKTLEAKLIEDNGSFVVLENKAGKSLRIERCFLSDPDIQFLREQSADRIVTLISGPDKLITASFESLLKDNGYEVTVLPSEAMKANLVDQTRLLILTHSFMPPIDDSFTGFLLALKKSKLPVIALSDSARTVLRQLELSVGQNLMMVSEVRAIPSNPLHTAFQKPRPVQTVSNEVVLYDKIQSGYAVSVPSIPAYLKPLVQTAGRPNFYPILLEDNRFLFWGFSGSPEVMSEQGRALFLNLVNYLIRGRNQEPELPEASAVPAAQPPPAPVPPVTACPAGMPSYPTAPVIYEAGKTPPGPAKDFKSCRLYYTSKENRAASAFYGFDAAMGIRSDRLNISKDNSIYCNYQQEDGVVYYTPRIKISAKNKSIPPNALLTIEYYSRPITGTGRNLEAVQHVTIPEIERGKDLMVDAGELGTYRYSCKTTSYKHQSGKEMYGIILTLFDSNGTLLFQQASQQSLIEAASLQPRPALKQVSQR
jgi:hypothetical protein